ncbi:MAG: 50S ribosomal protein L17 [Candidatus Woesebacteria bacterium GW2011_GWA1_45_8]|uniref:50S ribosomal protein L17 n=1 Tax=Candidatus Woesebacteria bacterium GW2011_GWA1_45_8 TaxID=1618559 RepID=A0A0G1QUJ7_9BACT|nr:MAG: 50S ribosomal protein L17 [Candidatus Woesebacteria bacterium GW2011_GWA1_45_8]
MKARVFGRHFSRGGGARKALFRSLISAFILNGKIETTKARAKAIQGQVDKLVATAKKDTIAGRRILSAFFAGDRKVVFELTDVIVPSLKSFSGGVTRAVPLPPRKGDAAKMVRLQWAAEIIKKEKVAEVKKAKGDKKEPKKGKAPKSKKATAKKVIRK